MLETYLSKCGSRWWRVHLPQSHHAQRPCEEEPFQFVKLLPIRVSPHWCSSNSPSLSTSSGIFEPWCDKAKPIHFNCDTFMEALIDASLNFEHPPGSSNPHYLLTNHVFCRLAYLQFDQMTLKTSATSRDCFL